MEYQLIAPRDPNISITEQILVNRGFQLGDLHYLNTSNEDILNPELIANIKDGAKLLLKHIQQNNKIYIQVDSDCDGYTSAAVLINYLNQIFPIFTQNNIIYSLHSNKAHGINLETVPKDTKLIIAPDSSSNEYDIHALLKEQGIDVLVIDHHLAEKVSEYACVINNQLCDYPSKSLSGVGMVYKFCSYIDSLLPKEKQCANNYLDLVALGLIADMVDLKDYEVRRLITLEYFPRNYDRA